jgi:CspA family cold shock protein
MTETGAVSPENNTNPTANGASSGRLKWFDAAKGYGFIEAAASQRDVFLHVKELRKSGIITLNDGVSVSFKCNDGPKGPFATDVRVTQPNPA